MQPQPIAAVALLFAWGSFVAGTSNLISFDKSLIPKVDSPLPVLSLGRPAAFPHDLLTRLVNVTAPNATLVTDESGGQYAYDGGRLVAIVDAHTGETRVFPNFVTIVPAAVGSNNTSAASTYIHNTGMFPSDNTKVSVTQGSSLVGTTTHRGQNASDPQVYLSHAIVERQIESGGKSYPVCGPGSKASFGFAANGELHSLSYLWQPATLTAQVIQSHSTDIVYNSIVEKLTPTAASSGPVRVDGVDVCFYDSSSNFIQPVYRFWATINPNSHRNNSGTTSTRIRGYLPIGENSPEPVTEPSNTHQQRKRSILPNPPVKRGPKADIKIGRYVTRQDASQWADNANNFLSNLQTPFTSVLSPIANFIDSQYYWAYPYLFTSEKECFVNSVHVAETEVHGNWHLFATDKNCCDLVGLTDIPADGYGGGTGGSLAYWILHSCEVIPTTTDYPAASSHLAFDDWFRIFNGLHAAVGYRTEMWIADSVMPTFGRFISLGAPFVSTWLLVVHDDTTDYTTNGADQLYFDPNRGINEPMGRPSAVVVCGHEYDMVTQVENLGRPDCLRELWYDNGNLPGSGDGAPELKVHVNTAEGAVTASSSSKKKASPWMIAGLSVAGLVVVVSLGLALAWFLRGTHKYAPLEKSTGMGLQVPI